MAFGLLILADLLARLIISDRPWRELLHPVTWADAAAIVSFLAPLVGEPAGFLRVLRTLRVLQSRQLLARLRADFPYFRANEAIIVAVAKFAVFLFVMTGFVYETQHLSNPGITNYADALYFTVTALTTTGFGDITLQGTTGRLISVVIMIFGVTLLSISLAPCCGQTRCASNALIAGCSTHDPDAVHCKACGKMLKIPNEDAD